MVRQNPTEGTRQEEIKQEEEEEDYTWPCVCVCVCVLCVCVCVRARACNVREFTARLCVYASVCVCVCTVRTLRVKQAMAPGEMLYGMLAFVV